MFTRCVSAIIFGFSLLCVGQSPGGDDDAAKKELQAIQGTWQVTSGEKDGMATDRFNSDKLTISSDIFTVHHDGKDEFKATIRLHPDKKPKAADVKFTEGNENGKTALGIYTLDGDDLKFCFNKPGGESRPEDFSTKVGSDRMVVVLKREKK
jgi:uncharacterized protein (TIGR03067 family)